MPGELAVEESMDLRKTDYVMMKGKIVVRSMKALGQWRYSFTHS